MTLDEFKKKLRLQYIFGMRFTDGASRRYSDESMDIGCEIHTPYNEKTCEWGEGKRYFYMENDERIFNTIEELFDAWSKNDQPRQDIE